MDTESTQGTFGPYVALSHDGVIAVAWSETTNPNSYENAPSTAAVMAKVFDAQGKVLMNAFNVGGADDATIAFDSADNFVIGYEMEQNNDNTGAGGADVFAKEYQLYLPNTKIVSGAVIRPEFRINSASFLPVGTPDFWPNSQFGSQVAMDADGDLTVSYSGFGPDVQEDSITQFVDSYLIDGAALGMSPADLAAYRLQLEGQYLNEYGATSGYDLDSLRGDADAAMYSQFDTDPLLQAPTSLSSDNIANNNRDGQDTTYLLDIDPAADSGGFWLNLSYVNPDGLVMTGKVLIIPVFLPNNAGVDAAATAKVIHDQLASCPILGVNWPMGTPVLVNLPSPYGPTYTAASDVRAGGPWDVTTPDELGNKINPNYYVFEITFRGEVHDTPITMTVSDNTMLKPLPGQDEIQTLTITVPTTNLIQAITDTNASTIYVQDGTAFPTGGFAITIDNEEMWVTSTGAQPYTTWTVVRGYNGTTAATHKASAEVFLNPASPLDFTILANGSSTNTVLINNLKFDAFNAGTSNDSFATGLQKGLQVVAGYKGTTVTYDAAQSDITLGTFVYTVDFAGASADTAEPLLTYVPYGTLSALYTSEYGVTVDIVETKKGAASTGQTAVATPDASCEIYGWMGTYQYNTSIAMTSSGSFVEVWNEQAVTNTGYYTNTNLYFRTFQENTDTAGPQVADWFAPGSTRVNGEDEPTISEGQQIVSNAGLTHIVLSFDQEMYDNATHTGDAVTNPLNYLLLQDNTKVSGNIVKVDYGLNVASDLAASDPADYSDLNPTPTNRWEVVLTIDANGVLAGTLALRDGTYMIEALAPTAISSGLPTRPATPWAAPATSPPARTTPAISRWPRRRERSTGPFGTT